MLKKKMVVVGRSIECQHSSSSKSGLYNIENVNSRRGRQTLKFHFHEVYEIYLFLKGNIMYHGENSSKLLERGDLILCNLYSFHCSQLMGECDYERIVINIDETSLRRISTDETDLSKCFDSDSSSINLYRLSEEEINRFVSIADSLADEIAKGGYCSDVMTGAYIAELLVLINRHTSEQVVNPSGSAMPEIVLKTLNFINEHLTEEISLETIGEALHHNSVYVSRRFRECTLLTISQYTAAKRIILAEKMLIQGSSPTDACFSSGFNNYTHFARTFKEVTGYSPREFGMMQKS